MEQWQQIGGPSPYPGDFTIIHHLSLLPMSLVPISVFATYKFHNKYRCLTPSYSKTEKVINKMRTYQLVPVRSSSKLEFSSSVANLTPKEGTHGRPSVIGLSVVENEGRKKKKRKRMRIPWAGAWSQRLRKFCTCKHPFSI